MSKRAKMLLVVLLIVLGSSLALGLAVKKFLDRYHGFTKDEAEAKIGRRVHVIDCSSMKTIGKRRDDPEGGWLDLKVGESGTVKRMEEVASNEYFLIVFWDQPKEKYPYRSYYRKSGQFSIYSECLAEE